MTIPHLILGPERGHEALVLKNMMMMMTTTTTTMMMMMMHLIICSFK